MIKFYQCTYEGCLKQHEEGTLCPHRGKDRPRITVEDIEKLLVHESTITRDAKTKKPTLIIKNKDFKVVAKSVMELINKKGEHNGTSNK